MKNLLLLSILLALFVLNTSFVLTSSNNDEQVEWIKHSGIKCYAAVPNKNGELYEATCWICNCTKLYILTKQVAGRDETLPSRKERKRNAKRAN